MPTTISNHFIVHNDVNIPDLEFYINKDGDIFFQEPDMVGGFWSVITKKDWQELKTFIDEQFKNE